MSKHSLSAQRGTSMVEFAFVAPVFFLLLFGIIEFSVILFDKATLTNASREGARAAILYKETDRDLTSATFAQEKTEVQNVVQNYAQNYLISLGGTSSITTTVTYNDRAPAGGDGEFNKGDEVTVDVRYPYQFLILPAFASDLADFTLGAITVMRAE